MATLLIGFVGLVILPAFILAEVLNRVIKDPVDSSENTEGVSFSLKTLPPKPSSNSHTPHR